MKSRCDHILLPDAEGYRCTECGEWYETRMADWKDVPAYGGLAVETWDEQKAYDEDCEQKKRHAAKMKALATDGSLAKDLHEAYSGGTVEIR